LDLADPEFAALKALSARLGRDPLRTQAAGGNTSLKRDGVLWIKASGTWLAEAETGDIFVPVRLEPLLRAVADADPRAETATDFIAREFTARDLRPSVETSVHAVMDRPVVVHIHDVATTAVAVRADAEAVLAERLGTAGGIDWLFIPYVKPGVPLSRAIAARMRPGTNVIVLGNHGLVVMADTVAEAGALADRVTAALEVRPRPAPGGDIPALRRLAEGSPYRLPKDAAAHGTAGDTASLAIAERGTLYPDHVVFLGPGTAVIRGRDALENAMKRADMPPLMLVVPDAGVLIHRNALPGADELARALADVTARIDPEAPVKVLTAEEERELISWDAELYRQKVAREARARTGA
jgi:rhamnose utilization protein RhaD (predicted bifunctional aldolase and dehydrogenase)